MRERVNDKMKGLFVGIPVLCRLTDCLLDYMANRDLDQTACTDMQADCHSCLLQNPVKLTIVYLAVSIVNKEHKNYIMNTRTLFK